MCPSINGLVRFPRIASVDDAHVGRDLHVARDVTVERNLKVKGVEQILATEVIKADSLVGDVDFNIALRAGEPKIEFGDRATGWDVNLYRAGADVLSTDDDLAMAGPRVSVIRKDRDTHELRVYGATSSATGASIELYGRDHPHRPGELALGFGGYPGVGALDVIFCDGVSWYLRARFTRDGQLQLPVPGPAGGLLLGGDANLYRIAPAELKTDGLLELAKGLRIPAGANIIARVASAPAVKVTETVATLKHAVGPVGNKRILIPVTLKLRLVNPAGSGVTLYTDPRLYFSDGTESSILPAPRTTGAGVSEDVQFMMEDLWDNVKDGVGIVEIRIYCYASAVPAAGAEPTVELLGLYAAQF